ncbi:MAG: hypothetical protein OXI75_13910, partial [Rhodospirillales bacterium]|nr:hypothetical protein [Rhodospirillales bacterium]
LGSIVILPPSLCDLLKRPLLIVFNLDTQGLSSDSADIDSIQLSALYTVQNDLTVDSATAHWVELAT